MPSHILLVMMNHDGKIENQSNHSNNKDLKWSSLKPNTFGKDQQRGINYGRGECN